jgi:hypothetical protein
MGRRRTNEMILSLFTGIYFIQRVALPEYYFVFTMEAITTLGCLFKDPIILNNLISNKYFSSPMYSVELPHYKFYSARLANFVSYSMQGYNKVPVWINTVSK